MTKEQKCFNQLLDKMFKMVGFKKFDQEFVKQDGWYILRNWTPEKEEEFHNFFIKKVMKDLKVSKQTAEYEWGWFILDYGWKVIN